MGAPEASDPAVAGGLELVVALLAHPLGELGEHLLDIELGHQPAEHGGEQAQVAHVGLDRLGDARVLDLDRKLGALRRAATMNLADARRRCGVGIDLGKHPLGRLAPFALEHPAHLLPSDRRDVVAQRGQPLLQILDPVGVEAGELDRRKHLTRLHRRAAHDRACAG
jgi:hypothetical protein